MNPQSSQEDCLKSQPRNFKCPCGKAYLSNAALYTHVKQKHNGKPPGDIQKPKLEGKPRGRPPLQKKNNERNDKVQDAETGDKGGASIYRQSFQIIQLYLREVQMSEVIDPGVYEDEGEKEENNTVKLFQSFLDQGKLEGYEGDGVPIGIGLAQFFQSVLMLLPESQTEGAKTEQIFLLFMFLLQYAIDDCNDPQIIKKVSIEQLITFVNPFIEDWIGDYAEFKGISHLWIMKKDNMVKIFNCFYSWLKMKSYTTYCITLIG